MHERSNRYYGTLSYFISKIFSDLIPLRVLPPILLSITTHFLVGLRGGIHFFTYSLVLVLMTSIAATINLIIGMLTKGIMSGILIATICMIHLILLTTIFVNFGMFWGGREGGREGGDMSCIFLFLTIVAIHSLAHPFASPPPRTPALPHSLLTQTR